MNSLTDQEAAEKWALRETRVPETYHLLIDTYLAACALKDAQMQSALDESIRLGKDTIAKLGLLDAAIRAKDAQIAELRDALARIMDADDSHESKTWHIADQALAASSTTSEGRVEKMGSSLESDALTNPAKVNASEGYVKPREWLLDLEEYHFYDIEKIERFGGPEWRSTLIRVREVLPDDQTVSHSSQNATPAQNEKHREFPEAEFGDGN